MVSAEEKSGISKKDEAVPTILGRIPHGRSVGGCRCHKYINI